MTPFLPRTSTISLVAFVLSLGAAGCSDRSSAAAAAADAAAIVRASDAGDGGGFAAADAGALPEETAMPHASADELTGRMRHLLEAIAQNNPDLATDVIFPRDAYAASKDAADPQKAWDRRLSGVFRRAIERTHNHTKGIEQAKFVSFEIGHSLSQLTPKKKDFKKPLWRVKHSRLIFSVDGKTKHIDVAEMTAWRGNWYITRLR